MIEVPWPKWKLKPGACSECGGPAEADAEFTAYLGEVGDIPNDVYAWDPEDHWWAEYNSYRYDNLIWCFPGGPKPSFECDDDIIDTTMNLGDLVGDDPEVLQYVPFPEGSPITFHACCGRCVEARKLLDRECGGWIYGQVLDEIIEHWDENELARTPAFGELVKLARNAWAPHPFGRRVPKAHIRKLVEGATMQ